MTLTDILTILGSIIMSAAVLAVAITAFVLLASFFYGLFQEIKSRWK